METIDKIMNAIPIMTVQDVANYLRFSTAKVYKMARDGRLPAARIGREWRFRNGIIDAWLEQSTEKNLRAEEKLIPADV